MQPDDDSRVDRETIARILERKIDERTHGRTSDIFVQVLEDRLIVHGRAKTYHVKQLVLEAIGKMTPILVELRIHVDTAKAQPERPGDRRMLGKL
jgi:hypothetical protein